MVREGVPPASYPTIGFEPVKRPPNVVHGVVAKIERVLNRQASPFLLINAHHRHSGDGLCLYRHYRYLRT